MRNEGCPPAAPLPLLRAPAPFRNVVAFLFLAVLPGCLTYDGNRAVVPFFEVYRDPPGAPFPPSSVAPAPAAHREAPPSPPVPIERRESVEVVVRPIVSWRDGGPEDKQVRVLWPVADFRRRADLRRTWVIPLWFRKIEGSREGGFDRRWMLFPFLYGGREDGVGGYFAFLPFGGKLRGILAQDEIDFYALPVYWHARKADFHTLHIFFPFYNRVWGGGRSGARLWPFYGRYRASTPDGRERYDRRFFLWPLFFYHKNDLHTRAPSTLIFFCPFYGQTDSDRTFNRTILWPFYQMTHDKITGRTVRFGLIFPYRFTEGQFDLWPIFGVKRTDEEPAVGGSGTVRRHRHFILWPVERYDHTEDDKLLSVRFWLLPVFWRFRNVRKADGQEDLEWKVWPLLRYTRIEAERRLQFPSPLPFRQEVPMERFYSRLWTLFLWKEDEAEAGWEALYNLVRYRKVKAEGTVRFTVLGGLFERSRGPQGVRWRFFYLPWR